MARLARAHLVYVLAAAILLQLRAFGDLVDLTHAGRVVLEHGRAAAGVGVLHRQLPQRADACTERHTHHVTSQHAGCVRARKRVLGPAVKGVIGVLAG